MDKLSTLLEDLQISFDDELVSLENESDKDTEDEEEEENISGYKGHKETGRYNKKFSVVIDGLYLEDAGGMDELNYDVLDKIEDMDDILLKRDVIDETTEYNNDISFQPLVGLDEQNYSGSGFFDKLIEDQTPNDYGKQDMLSLEYDSPDMINGQKTYQRIVFEADRNGESVYDLTMRKFSENGIELSVVYDKEFDSMLFTSMNDKTEGAGGNFNEFYKEGEIGNDAVDKEMVKKGEIIEWRYAEETDGSCGGVPDFHRIKNLLYQQDASGSGYVNAQDSIFPNTLPQMRNQRSYESMAPF